MQNSSIPQGPVYKAVATKTASTVFNIRLVPPSHESKLSDRGLLALPQTNMPTRVVLGIKGRKTEQYCKPAFPDLWILTQKWVTKPRKAGPWLLLFYLFVHPGPLKVSKHTRTIWTFGPPYQKVWELL